MGALQLVQGPPVFFFNDTATTEIYTLSLHDALPISSRSAATLNFLAAPRPASDSGAARCGARCCITLVSSSPAWSPRSEKYPFGSIALYQFTTQMKGVPNGWS